MIEVLIGFGSNQGDPERTCRQAVEALDREAGIQVERVSSLYRTSPVGTVQQDWFINGVALCRTSLDPEGLLTVMARIEADFGRRRTVHWGPRTLDLDILSFGDRVVALPHLRIPHPWLQERLFVLVPLVEVAPGWVHPILGVTAAILLDRLRGRDHQQEVLELKDP